MKSFSFLRLALGLTFTSAALPAATFNLKVVTDSSPDYSDMASLARSITAKWNSPEEKCWAVFYWNHIGRRQTSPMILHGLELTDPVRQFNDYGYTMCSTISGINCAIWQQLGLPARFWDISLHTVPEVFYDERWHMYDNSMSALYVLCDGRTLAGVEDIGKSGACELSHGKVESGHVAKYHCVNGTGPNGFLTGADTQRSLDEEAHCFNTNGLKLRNYYFNWDSGHRYILNLRKNESYTRHYKSLGAAPEFYIPNNGKDPDDRYHLRGNGVWNYKPDLSRKDCIDELHSFKNVTFAKKSAHPTKAGEPAELVFKIQGANVITSQKIHATILCPPSQGRARIETSANNGLRWTEAWSSDKSQAQGVPLELHLAKEVNGAYEVLIKVVLEAAGSAVIPCLENFEVDTVTMLNAKTQPKLNLGRNTVFVGTGAQTDSTVLWPELQGGRYKSEAIEEKNVGSVPEHPGYQGALFPVKARQDAYLIYRLDAPRDLTDVQFGGRFYNRAPESHIDLLYSLDGQHWTNSWSLQRTAPPWDVIHYETAKIAPGHKTVWVKYLMNSTEASPAGCGIYALRIEGNYAPANTGLNPFQVSFNWSEIQPDRSLRERFHVQTVDRLPFKYEINVGGTDHPIVNWMQIGADGSSAAAKDGYSDATDSGGRKFMPQKLICGRNLAQEKPYSLSKPSRSNWGAGDDGKKLTAGAGAPSYAGGTSYKSSALWNENENPTITVDLEAPSSCASFGMNFHGYPWWDALKGEIQDKVEVLTSLDGTNYVSNGFLKTDMRWVDLPVNYMWTDEETMTSATFRVVPPKPVQARYVKFQVANKRSFACAGIEVLDSIRSEPSDLRIAMPDEKTQ